MVWREGRTLKKRRKSISTLKTTSAQLAGNAKSGHFSTFSNGTPYIYYVHSSYVYEKGKKGKKEFFWIC